VARKLAWRRRVSEREENNQWHHQLMAMKA
jgi:hypothetical protein